MRRWLVPTATAVATVVLLGGMWYFAGSSDSGVPRSGAGAGSFAGGGSNGSGSSEPGSPGTADPGILPPEDGIDADAPATPTDPLAVTVGSYRLTKDPQKLSLSYWIGVPECYGTIAEPLVDETADAVTVTLTRVPPRSTGDVACIDIALQETVEIHLDRPLDGRGVLDGSSDTPVSKALRPAA
jgi:hypothetical protein